MDKRTLVSLVSFIVVALVAILLAVALKKCQRTKHEGCAQCGGSVEPPGVTGARRFRVLGLTREETVKFKTLEDFIQPDQCIGRTLLSDVKTALKQPKTVGTVGTILAKDVPESATHQWNLMVHLPAKPKPQLAKGVPVCFDLRREYPGWISAPLDQDVCGSCWAFATTGTLTDRIRIATKGLLPDIPLQYTTPSGTSFVIRDPLSPYLLAGCDFCADADRNRQIYKVLVDSNNCNAQCDGGTVQYAFIYLHQNGMVTIACNLATGGQYKCHSVSSQEQQRIGLPGAVFGACVLFRIGVPYRVSLLDPNATEPPTADALAANERAIQQEIMGKGTVTATFRVYSSFFAFFEQYPTGIYNEILRTDDVVGGHAVSIVGWGEDPHKHVKYWLVRNSYSPLWGDNGYFRILRGQNFCEFETDVWAAMPDSDWVSDVLQHAPAPSPAASASASK